jgi:hypothetical protein
MASTCGQFEARKLSHAEVERLFEVAGRLLASSDPSTRATGRRVLIAATAAWQDHFRRYVASEMSFTSETT